MFASFLPWPLESTWFWVLAIPGAAAIWMLKGIANSSFGQGFAKGFLDQINK